MRITQNITQSMALSTMQGHAKQLAAAQQRAITGLRVQKASDDPVAAAGSMQTGGSLRALDQYRRNMQAAQSRADMEESALDGLSTLLVRAKELAVSQGTDTANAATRAVVKAEVDQLLRAAAELGNAQIGGSYVFGGNRADRAPVVWTGSPERPTVDTAVLDGYNHSTEIGAGQFLKVTHNARELFPRAPLPAPGDTPPPSRSALDALAALSDALGSGDSAAVRASMPGLDAAHGHLQNLIGDAGARSNHLRMTTANLEALEVNLRTFKSDLEEVDLEKAITDLVGKQTAYQAAMMATSRVMGMTLMDYLR